MADPIAYAQMQLNPSLRAPEELSDASSLSDPEPTNWTDDDRISPELQSAERDDATEDEAIASIEMEDLTEDEAQGGEESEFEEEIPKKQQKKSKSKKSSQKSKGSTSTRKWAVPYDPVAIPFSDWTVEKIFAVRPSPTNPNEDEYYVKFKGASYIHCKWVSPSVIEAQTNGGQRITHFLQKGRYQIQNWGELGFNPAYLRIDRVIDEGELWDEESGSYQVYYLVKWESQSYDSCTWELRDDVLRVDPDKLDEFEKRRRLPPYKERLSKNPAARPPKPIWKKYEESPEYKNQNKLRSYQLEGVNWLTFCWVNKQSSIMADEMGLGKTVQSVTFLNELYNTYDVRGPFLIIAPLSTIPHWEREFRAWTDLNVIVFHGNQTSRNLIVETEFYYRTATGEFVPNVYKFDVIITTYETALTGISQLRPIRWKAVVLDEAHRLKNKASKATEALKGFHMEHRVLLTGTPLQNSLEELWSLLNFMDPQQFADEKAFLAEYGQMKTSADVDKLQQLLKPLMLRRLKEDVETSIPIKEETIVMVELTNIQKKWYRAILEKNFTHLKAGFKTERSQPSLSNVMMELRKCCIHPYLIKGAEDITIQELNAISPEAQYHAMIQASGKMVLIDKLLKKLKAGGHKVLIFSQMTKCLDLIGDYLRGQNYLSERIDGAIRGVERQAAIDRFSAPGSPSFVFLLCTRAGGVGINLTAADTVIIFDSDWNPQNDLQAQARCHRIGQTRPVQIYRLITRNSYENEMFDRASMKLGLDKAILQKMDAKGSWGEETAPQLDKKEIENLLKRGAYGAYLDDTESNDFCEEDIDQILSRRTTVIRHDNTQAVGSIFSKATFAASNASADVDIDDPNFWDKFASKAGLELKDESVDLMTDEPRLARRVARSIYDVPEGLVRCGPLPDGEIARPWSFTEKLALERKLTVYGLWNWEAIQKFVPRRTVRDIKGVTRGMIVYLMRLILDRKNDSKLAADLDELLEQHREPDFPVDLTREDIPYEDAVPREVAEYQSFLLDAPREYHDHLRKKGKFVLVRLQLLKQINELVPDDITAAKKMEMPTLASPGSYKWWGVNEDRDLLIGIKRYGYHQFEPMLGDPDLCFSQKKWDTSSLERADDDSKGKNSTKDDDMGKGDDDQDVDVDSMDVDSKAIDDEVSEVALNENEEKTTFEHVYAWPSKSDLGLRLRRVVAACIRLRKKRLAEEIERKTGPIRWSKRERSDYYKTVTIYGLERSLSDNKGLYDWDRFRQLANLVHKSDTEMDEYLAFMLALCLEVIEKDDPQMAQSIKSKFEIENVKDSKFDVFVGEEREPLSVERAKRVFRRVEFMKHLRECVLHPEFESRIMEARKTPALPAWWIVGTHDAALLQGIARHGYNRFEDIVADPELPFHAIALQYRQRITTDGVEIDTSGTKKNESKIPIIHGLPWLKEMVMTRRVDTLLQLISQSSTNEEETDDNPESSGGISIRVDVWSKSNPKVKRQVRVDYPIDVCSHLGDDVSTYSAEDILKAASRFVNDLFNGTMPYNVVEPSTSNEMHSTPTAIQNGELSTGGKRKQRDSSEQPASKKTKTEKKSRKRKDGSPSPATSAQPATVIRLPALAKPVSSSSAQHSSSGDVTPSSLVTSAANSPPHLSYIASEPQS